MANSPDAARLLTAETHSPNDPQPMKDGMPVAPGSKPPPDDKVVADTDDLAAEAPIDDTDTLARPRSGELPAPVRSAIVLTLVIVGAMTGLVGWLGYRDYRSHQTQTERSQFLPAAKQVAVNLTTIDWHHAEADVQRILDTTTGQLHDDFNNRSKPLIDIVKQVHATNVGTVTAAGLESQDRDTAQALVVASVQGSDANAPDQTPREWRLRLFVQRVDGRVKASKMEFVP